MTASFSQWIRRMKPWLVLIIASLGLFVFITGVWGQALVRPQAAVRTQAIGFTLDFETADLRGWTATGNVFACQPTLGDNPSARQRGQPSRHLGRYWIGTFECYGRRPGQKPGNIQGDRPQGTLTSAPFTIPAGTLSFLIGGGSSTQTRVELLVGKGEFPQRAFTATGKNTETMGRVTWDLTPHAGKTGRIRIVDASSTVWGHINVDDFRFSSRPSSKDDVAVDSRPRITTAPATVVQVPPVTVPNVVGSTTGRAQETLANVGLQMKIGERRVSTSRPGSVIEQTPTAGARVARGSTVAVVVAQGVGVPNLDGRKQEEARTILGRARLVLGRVTERLSERAPGTILSQSPRARTVVPLGARVSVVVAQGVRVPSLIGLDRQEAESRVSQARLRLGQVEQELSERPLGTILRQDPEAGTTVPLGTRVRLVVAQGVPVPSLVDHMQENARSILEQAQLRLGRVELEKSTEPLGTILRQDPEAGTVVTLSTPVRIVLAQGVTVLNVVGLDRQEAKERLEDANLQVGTVEDVITLEWPGKVLWQDLDPGMQVAVGTAVNLHVASWLAAAAGIAGFLGVLGGGSYLLRSSMRNGSNVHERAGLKVVAKTDRGSQQLEAPVTAASSLEVRLRGVRGEGKQTIELRGPIANA